MNRIPKYYYKMSLAAEKLDELINELEDLVQEYEEFMENDSPDEIEYYHRKATNTITDLKSLISFYSNPNLPNQIFPNSLDGLIN